MQMDNNNNNMTHCKKRKRCLRTSVSCKKKICLTKNGFIGTMVCSFKVETPELHKGLPAITIDFGNNAYTVTPTTSEGSSEEMIQESHTESEGDEDSFSDIIFDEEKEENKPIPQANIITETEEEEVKEGVKNSSCSICFDQKATHAFMECGHMCICRGCAEKMNNLSQNGRRCPLCMKESHTIRKIYLNS